MSRAPHLPPEPVGWPLAPSIAADGTWSYPDLERSIRDQIKVILLTRPGELLLHPTFGAGLEDLLHEPNTLTARRRIRDRIEANVTRFEPRIALDRVEVWSVADRPEAVRVELAYRILRTGKGQAVTFDVALGS
ncbi:MAG: baseplate assembly protein [Geminicoccaceae bacterium]|nr:MAG: baseplate assembly protein [Geminicoccaceae bacterium]